MKGTLRRMGAALAATVVMGVLSVAPVGATAGDAAATRSVTGQQVKKRQMRKAKIVFLDTRSSIDGEVIDGAYNVPPDVVDAWATRVSKSTYIVAYCTCEDDGLAIQAVQALQRLGFTNAYVLKGGLDAARAAGVPMGRLAG